MALINPRIAKRERQKLRLSLDELARKSGVNKATLHRIETGRMKRNAEHVVSRLAKVFKLEAEELTIASTDDDDGDAESVFSYRSQLNVRRSHEARNALSLAAWRYGVKALDILELAPLMFHLVAAETLKERAAQLAKLREARDQIAGLSVGFPHLHERMVNDWNGEEIDQREERSIAARDLRGDKVDDGEDFVDTRPYDYDDGAQNPFVTQVRHRLAAVQAGDAEPELFEYWADGIAPRYEICREEARDYLGGDSDAAEEIVMGRVGLHEIPRELRVSAATPQRAQWVRERAAELGARNAEWLDKLGLGDLGL